MTEQDRGMKTLTRPPDQIRYPVDVKSIRLAMNELGYDASDSDIQWAYEGYCDERYAATWCMLDMWKEGAITAAKHVIEILNDGEAWNERVECHQPAAEE